jgi:hypothetical protein
MRARAGFTAVLRNALAPLLLAAIGLLSATAQGAGVAMVTDLQGKATASSQGRSRDLAILDELEAEALVQLDPGTTLVVLYLDTGYEYVCKGAATIEFRPGQPEAQGGPKPERRNLAVGKGGKEIRIKSVGMVQGAMVMRSIRADTQIQLLNLDKARTLETRPEFRWKELQPGLEYGFELIDETGRTILESQVTATSMALPANVRLREGVPYVWKVSARLPNGRTYASSSEFAIAPADVRAQARDLRPPASAPLSARIAYAAWLDQMELKDEARKYWAAASAERPESPRLRALAVQ